MKIRLITTAIAAIALSSCSPTTMDVEASGVEGVNYAAYKTYAWVPLGKAEMEGFSEKDKLVRSVFIGEVDGVMSRRGFTKVEAGKADLFVYVRGARMPGFRQVGQGPRYGNLYEPSEDGSSWLAGGEGLGPGGEGYLKSETQAGIRFLISEPKTDKVVWRGKGFVGVDDSRSETMVHEDVKRLARKLTKGFPPKG